MKIDRSTVEALASPTRIDILRAALDGESTTTDISDELGKTKSTVSSHLEKLTDAGLLEKDEAEGRRRVVYRPTRKAKSIIEGRTREMQFSLVSGFIMMIAAGASFWNFFDPLSMQSGSAQQSADSMTAMSMEAASSAAEASGSGAPGLETVFLLSGVFFISLSALSFIYGYALKRLRSG